MKYFGYSEGEFIPSEISGLRASDIHHLSPRGMGGSKTKDNIENLIAVTRMEHNKCESNPAYNEEAKQIHLKLLNDRKAIT